MEEKSVRDRDVRTGREDMGPGSEAEMACSWEHREPTLGNSRDVEHAHTDTRWAAPAVGAYESSLQMIFLFSVNKEQGLSLSVQSGKQETFSSREKFNERNWKG